MNRLYEFNRAPNPAPGEKPLLNTYAYHIDSTTGAVWATRFFEMPHETGVEIQRFPFNPVTIEEDIEALRALAAISLEETRRTEKGVIGD